MYKQLVMESKRVSTKQTETYIQELVGNFVKEINTHNQVQHNKDSIQLHIRIK